MKTIAMQRDGQFTIFTPIPPKVRRSWGQLSPVTRVKGSAKTYTRKPKHQTNNV